MSSKTITLDVRDDIRHGREPFSKIISATAALQPDEQLLLIAPFEPKPLFAVLGKQGFSHTAKVTGSGDWEVVFLRLASASTDPIPPTAASNEFRNQTPLSTEEVWEVDARGLEPPQPMVKILETLAALPAGKILRARTDRRPMHLYPQLEQRGFLAETEEQSDGSYLTQIRHR